MPPDAAVSKDPVLLPVLAGDAGIMHALGIVAWTVCFVFFWDWWLRPAHIDDLLPYITVSTSLLWATLTPAYFLFIFARSRRPSPTIDVHPELRIAMVVTKAPSEPFEIVAKTLEAMLAQDLLHHTWLADEAPTAETLAWAKKHGVFVSTRHGVADYHRATWPRRTRCKEGNLAYFYDHYGYDMYDVVVQLDADHVPERGYLRAMVQPFADPRVGYVSAPSICDSNASESWSARGRLYAEASMHGSLQAGYNSGWAPLCIGSHYAVRTAALRQVGGLGPELAEDHSTTLIMNAGGWHGVHAVDAIAHGLGPSTFADLAVQEFQWSRSLVAILLQHTRRYLAPLPFRLKFQFLFSQLWYPLFALTMLLSFVMPIVALLFDFTFVDVAYVDFVLHFSPMAVVLTVLAFNWRASGTFRPYDAKILAWETVLFTFARWPWAILGTIAAIADTVLRRRTEFRITPKGTGEAARLPVSVLAPYATLSIGSSIAAFLIDTVHVASGYYLFAVINALLYGVVFAAIILAHWMENPIRRRGLRWATALGSALILTAFPALAAGRHGLTSLEAIAWHSGFTLTEPNFSVAGANMGGSDLRRLTFKFKWIGDTDQR